MITFAPIDVAVDGRARHFATAVHDDWVYLGSTVVNQGSSTRKVFGSLSAYSGVIVLEWPERLKLSSKGARCEDQRYVLDANDEYDQIALSMIKAVCEHQVEGAQLLKALRLDLNLSSDFACTRRYSGGYRFSVGDRRFTLEEMIDAIRI